MDRTALRRAASRAGVVLLTALLAACLLAPGRFTSSLDVRRNGQFRFAYSGELYFLPLMKSERDREFVAKPCSDAETGQTRPCSREEIAQQRDAWAAQKRRERQSSAAAAAMMGGLDFDDPKAPEVIAERLRRQKGWRRVDYKGAGTFDVAYDLAGQLDHDFVFPSIEGFAWANALVMISPRKDGSVRIDAPGYAPGGGMNALGGAMAMGTRMAGAMASKTESEDPPAPAPIVDGTFTITTDAPILANNTDEGPKKAGGAGQTLTWAINSRAPAPPTALLQLDPD
ncbi:hypothetical protein [Novosphingobium aquimarinum]|uniref:hypothetical protein n=1 Tax=Novosphingobium aquimarinum TaxID=2682494 RepID=UPI0012EC730E|nr:hypothetical protein [Novosphingobium aquimarinum]